MQEDHFLELISSNSNNAKILERLPEIDINDALLVSGSLFQTVWNGITDRPITYGIKDYDVFYFDDSDLSWDAEDAVIGRAAKLFRDLGINVEVRNQARVHLWYEQRFELPYTPLKSSSEGIDRFLATACMVGLRPGPNPQLYAPKGLDDLQNMVLRPNLTSNFSKRDFDAKVQRWKNMWPELRVEIA